jgi:hypothetical protein
MAIKNKKLSIVLLVIGMLIGPLGTIKGILGVGDKAFSGSNNIKAIDSYYLIDYLTISASFNLVIIFALALIGWIIKFRKVRLSKILFFILIGHLFFIPSFFISLFLSVIPVEGNIKGFIIFPAFALTALGGIIAFLIFFIIKLVKTKKENSPIFDIKPLIPYLISIIILVLLQLRINNESTTDVELISFKHENFTWGINQQQTTKAGMVQTAKNAPYNVYIKHKNADNDSSNIKLLKNYHSLYTKLDSVVPVQSKIIKYMSENSEYVNHFDKNDIEINLSNKNELIYRIRNDKTSYTICLSNTEANLNALGFIANDIKQEDGTTYINEIVKGLVLEAVAISKEPITEEKFLKSDGSYLQISENGDVKYKDILIGDAYELVILGKIKESVYYSVAGTYSMDSFVNDTYIPINYGDFLNSKNQSLETLYTHVNGRDCATNIETAIDKCPNIEHLYLVDPIKNKGIPVSIERLYKLSHLNTKGINIGKIPESICESYALKSINFNDSKTLTFPDCFGDLIGIYSIDVVNCNLKEVPKAFYNLKNLYSLNLKGNNIIKVPKDVAQLKLLDNITVDFNPNLDIALEILSKKNLSFNLVVYNEKDKQTAENFIKKHKKSDAQVSNQNTLSWRVVKEY